MLPIPSPGLPEEGFGVLPRTLGGGALIDRHYHRYPACRERLTAICDVCEQRAHHMRMVELGGCLIHVVSTLEVSVTAADVPRVRVGATQCRRRAGSDYAVPHAERFSGANHQSP
jgi:hypothetical protein